MTRFSSRRLTPIALALVLPVVASCGPARQGPPEIVADRTACSHCGMLISEPVYAAAYRAGASEARAFDDIGCLLEAARRDGDGAAQFWFHDVPSGAWIEGSATTFVKASTLRTPMGGGIIAFRDRAAAERAAAARRGTIVRSLADLMTHKGDVP